MADFLEIKKDFDSLKENYKTKDIDLLIKEYLKNKEDVSCLKEIILKEDKYHRFYFGVSLLQIDSINNQLDFIEDNFNSLSDWWHVDELNVFIKDIPLKEGIKRSKKYIKDKREYVRRWGYVLLIKNLWKEKGIEKHVYSLFKDDSSFHVKMSEAWLLSYLAVSFKKETYEFIKNSNLSYDLLSKAIQKINDSFRISKEDKESFKALRKELKERDYGK